MKNIDIMTGKKDFGLDRKINLKNGSLVIQKLGDEITGVYLVTSFRSNGRSQYRDKSTSEYCTLINLDTGCIAFEERCSRATTERRVLRHLLHPAEEITEKYDMRISVYPCGDYRIGLKLFEEQILNGTRLPVD